VLGGRLVPNVPDGSDMAPFRLAMAIMTGLIVAVALAHLAATALGSARERARDTDALRAVGCTGTQIAVSAAVSAALSGICALIVGLPVGWALQRVLGDAITAGVGLGPGAGGTPPIAGVTLTATCLLVLGVVVESSFTATTGRRRRSPSAS
jgi:putative ABC transport system permease protein